MLDDYMFRGVAYYLCVFSMKYASYCFNP